MAKTDIQDLVEVYEMETDKENKDLLLDGLKKIIERDMKEADAEYKKFLTGIKSKFFGAKKSPAKKTTAKKSTAKKSTAKKSTTTPEEKAEKQRKVNQSAGKTIDECKEIIAKYESLRSGNKKRVDKLEKEGKIIEGTDVKTAGASTETLSKEVKGKIDKQVDAIEKKAEKEAKKEVKTAGKSDAQVKKEVAKKTDAKIEKELSKLSKEMSSKAKEFIMSIKSVLSKDNPDEAKAFLLSVKAGIDAELKQFMAGGELAGAVQGYEIAWAGAGRPLPMYAKGGELSESNLKRRLKLINVDANRILKDFDDEVLNTEHSSFVSLGTLVDNIEIASDLTTNESDSWILAKGGKLKYKNLTDRQVKTLKELGYTDSQIQKADYREGIKGVGKPSPFINTFAKGGKLNVIDSDLEQKMLAGVSAKELDTVLDTQFPDSFSLEIFKRKDDYSLDADYGTQLSDKDLSNIKFVFREKTSPRTLNFEVQQGGENTYFHFALFDTDYNNYVGTFGFKDRGDVDSSYVTKFISFLCDAYGYPLQANVYAKGGNIDDTPKIYVADLEAYNNGQLVGEWVDLSEFDSGDEVMERISELLEEFGDKEEYAIHDYENFDSSLYSEYMGENEFDQIIQSYKVSEQFDIPAEVVQSIMTEYSPDDIFEWIEERYEGEFDSDTDLAYNYVENVGGIENVSNPEYYFDYEKFGRDLAMDYSEYNGHYFRSYAKGGNVPSYDLSKYVTGSYAKGGNTQLDAFMKREMERQAKAEAGKNFPKYRVSVYEDSYQFDQYSTNDFAEAVNWATEKLKSQMAYRPTDKSFWAEISQFQAIEERNNVIYPYKEIARWSSNSKKTFAKGGELSKDMKGNFEWAFNWNEGGFNSVYAKTKAQAIKEAEKLGYPSYMPDNEYARKRSLKDVQDKFGKKAVDHIKSELKSKGLWSNKDQKRYYPEIDMSTVGFSQGLTPNVNTLRKVTKEGSRDLDRLGNMMSM